MLVTADGKVANPPFNFDNIQYPSNIEAAYSDAELAAIGLSRVIDNGPPPDTLVIAITPTKQSNGTFVAIYTTQPIQPAIPPSISVRQFWQQMALQGVIQTTEALAAMMNGTLPAPVNTIVSNLKGADQFSAQIKLVPSNPSLLRADKLVSEIATAYKMADADMDSVYLQGALL